MAYQILARKYRPQRFEDVVGQRGVTQTLRNAIISGRLAQAYVFAGPRGVGKTTTARIFAKTLNCDKGPTADPCGKCDPCTEITEGRDIDVFEIDAATHTGIDNVREVIIAGLAIAPVRDRYKIFIIDEVHQLSTPSFNALLKSIEEPPPHVMFMMATTELRKIPQTVLSRSQVFELRTISTQIIVEQLQSIATAEKMAIDTAGVHLIARFAGGSMRDAQSALDQVRAFAGDQITVDEVSTVLGLIGRDPVLDAVEVVADENAAGVFDLAGRFVEGGYDLRLVCRELTRVLRDMLVILIDGSRAEDPEIAGDAERDRLVTLAKRFSREDLMRAFDILARVETEIGNTAEPRHHLELALLKWIHLRKLVPLTELLTGGAKPNPSVAPSSSPKASLRGQRPSDAGQRVTQRSGRPTPPKTKSSATSHEESSDEKATILNEIKRRKQFFHGTVVAQAQHIDFTNDRLVFTFTTAQRTLALQLTQSCDWLETMASKALGRKVTVSTQQAKIAQKAAAEWDQSALGNSQRELRDQVMDHSMVQAILEVFPADIRDVEKIDP
jgi:DNA polymerase-3 subunit gamma/tau